MSDFIVSEAEESEDEEELTEAERKRLKKLKEKQRSDSDEEDDDDDDGREDLKDLIDDNPIEDEDSASSESDAESSDGGKRKRDDDDELDDRLSEEDYELLEENLGVKMKRKKQFKRLKRIEDDESEDEGSSRVPGVERDAIANELFEGSDAEEDRRHSREKASDRGREEPDKYSEEEEEEDEEDIGDFIVDAEGRPIHEKRKKRKAIYTDAALQQAQDIFGVDFDYEDLEQEPEDYEDEEEEEEYEGEDGERVRKKVDRRGPKKKTQRKTIYELYEPSELERGHFTDFDNQIRNTDIPERMQLRHIPVTPAEEGGEELVEEAEWIYKHAFLKPYISIQEGDSDGRDKPRKGSSAIAKIRKALEFMRNLHLEVPFIAFYRKEYVQPELNINDLWRVYRFDEKWCQLQNRKQNMLRLFERMQKYQTEKLTQNIEDALPDSVRLLKNEDIERLRGVQSLEELNDVYAHFMLYYSNDVSDMQEAYKKKQQEENRERRKNMQRNADGEEMEEADVNPPENEEFGSQTQPEQEATVKQAKRNDQYTLCVKAGLDGLIKKFGLSPEQFAENLRDNYQRHEVEQYPADSLEAAQEYLGTKFSSCNEVLNAAVFMLATQIAKEPQVRQCVREAFYERAKITVVPTKQGLKEIDESHPLYPMKFLKDKPVRDLMSDQFLRIVMGEQDKLLTLTFETSIEGLTSPSYVDEAKQLFHRDEFSRQVQDWNDLRSRVVDMALSKIIFPALTKELKARLLGESREAVVKSCCYKLYNWLKVAPYKVDFTEEEEDEWDTRNGLRVMALSYVPDLEQAAFASLVNMDGECTDHLRLEHILKRKNAWREADRAAKEKDLSRIRNFIFTKKPHVIAVSGESREALMLVEDLKGVVATLVQDEQFPMINVELMDNSLAKVFSNSTKAESEFREYPHLLRESISIARRLQDPLIEFSQLCNSDEEILCLKYHSLQDQIPKEELQEALYLEFINRVNEVGVDINRALNFPYTANLVQFICGLGARKGQALLKILKQSNQRLENRTQLVTACHMGPKVFINCAGFIKIDTNSLGDSTDSYVEVLDGSRVHPETYEWARKMAVDALEYDDEDANPAGAVEEILEAPERLKDLDLDAFADELERQGFGNKSITLYDIRAELNHRYKDLRASYQSPSPEEVFNMVTKETPETFYIGKMVMATVTGFTHRKPQREQLDRANPVRNEETGLWQCPFCFKNDFTDLSEVWNHFDAGACPGQATGVLVRLENGLNGFIPIKFLSDREVSNPEERVRPGQNIHCRVMKIDVERFSVSCTSKSSDLLDKNGEWRPPKDPFYDASAEERLLEQDQKSKKQKNQLSYTRRVIVHPSFKNVSYRDAEKMMTNMDQGEVIIRPSSKGTDHLTVTWKVAPEIYQHVDVREEGKENVFSLGKSLWIGDEEYEDLDEIIARYVNPMAAHARDILGFRYFRDLGLSGQPVVPGKEREKAEETIKEDKKKNPSKIHYFVSASRELPGKFMLSYLPRSHAKHEYITVTPEGFRFRGQVFESLTSLFCWFKEHFREPPPGTPRAGGGGGASRTPGFAGSATPNVSLAGMNAETLQRVAQSIPSHMLHSLSQAAHFQGTPGPYGYSASTPYTPSGQTPFMTPYAATPHQPQTPKYTTTPSAGSSTPGPSSFPAATPTPGSSAVFRTPASSSVSRGGGSFATPTAPSPYSSRRQPGTPASSSSGGFSQGSTPGRPAPGQSRSAQSSEPVDWRRAAEAWAQSRQKPSHSASSSGRADDGKGQSRSGTGATPRHDDKDRSSRPAPSSSSRGGGSNTPGRNPRTPKSPRSMDVGDATPLYDE